MNLVSLGLKDADAGVQRAALMRLLEFPAARAMPLMQQNAAKKAAENGPLWGLVESELESRKVFPFLATNDRTARELSFPSREGTGPVVSPDGKWVAYVETGWGRPGGSGGMGGSNLISIVHIVGSNGASDRVVSDLFLAGWLSDSQRVGTVRDGYATIVDLNGKSVAEFGAVMEKPAETYQGFFGGGGVWPQGSIRSQMGNRMPHTRRLEGLDFQAKGFDFTDVDWGDQASFSPDGKWFGPRRIKGKWQFIDGDNKKIEWDAPKDWSLSTRRAIWSPDGAYVAVFPLQADESEARAIYIMSPAQRRVTAVIDADQVARLSADFRKIRWNPWSKDGRRIAFTRGGQIWASDPDGTNARQMTFDASEKFFPSFSLDGSKIAYVAFRLDDRLGNGYRRIAHTVIWVVDCATGLAASVTALGNGGNIEGVDWLDDHTLIYDRLISDRESSLKTFSIR
jgi:hypothetical protein